MRRGSVILLFVGCGVDVVGGATGPAAPPPAAPDSGAPPAAPLEDARAVVPVDAAPEAAACTDPCSCDAGGAGCPAGSTSCAAGTCTARIEIAVRVDGRSTLVLAGSTLQWHHIERDPPGPTVVAGAAWSPRWPGPPKDCDCLSDTAVLSPPLPMRAQVVATEQLDGRTDVVVEQPSSANGYQLRLLFDDDDGGADDYRIVLTYESR